MALAQTTVLIRNKEPCYDFSLLKGNIFFFYWPLLKLWKLPKPVAFFFRSSAVLKSARSHHTVVSVVFGNGSVVV